MRVVFDIETDGLLRAEGDKPEVTKIHSLVLKDIDTGRVYSCSSDSKEWPIQRGLGILAEATEVSGHNIITYDLPVIQKLCPDFTLRSEAVVFDTLVVSRLIWADITDTDFQLQGKTGLPSQLIGKHSLEAWGYRLGLHKGDFNNKATDWSHWTPAMQVYCERDVEITLKLYNLEKAKKYSQEAIDLEHDFQRIIHLQEQTGFCFDQPFAQQVYSKMAAKRDELKRKLQEVFPPRIETMKTPAYWVLPGLPQQFNTKGEAEAFRKQQKLRKMDPVPGPLKTKEHPFNPDSNQQVAERLKEKYGWQPNAFTPSGQVKIDDEILSDLKYPEAALLSEYAVLVKRIAQIAEGDQGWLKHVVDGRLYGTMTTNGAVTGRCTHRLIVNVPKFPQPWGEEMRSCFIATPGWWLVGCDASGLEARVQGHFLHPYDNGAFIESVLLGDKAKGTDIHSINRDALGLPKDNEHREISKKWYYAFLYGSGNYKSGILLGISDEEIALYTDQKYSKIMEQGRKFLKKNNLAVSQKNLALCVKGSLKKKEFLQKSPTLAKLIEDVQAEAKANGYLIGLDGRRLNIRSEHAALNTLFQSGGALVMKMALVILWAEVQRRGWVYGLDFRLLTNVHDEIQAEAPTEERAHEFGKLAAECIKAAGEYFKFRCPLEGEYKVGKNWHQTH